RAAEAPREQHVELAAEADDDERRRTRERAPAADEGPHGVRPARAETEERAAAEVDPVLVARLLPERRVALDDVPAGAGEGETEKAVRAVRPVVGAEQSRAQPEALPPRRSGRSSGTPTHTGPPA